MCAITCGRSSAVAFPAQVKSPSHIFFSILAFIFQQQALLKSIFLYILLASIYTEIYYTDSLFIFFSFWYPLQYGLLRNFHFTRIMPRKRKASSPVYTNRNHESRRKRWKETYILSSSEGEQEVNEIGGEEYPINCILDEDDTRYLIDWEGPWSPTWVSRNNSSLY